MKRFSETRKIKVLSNPLNKNQSNIHPITLDLITNENDYKIIPSQFFIKDSQLEYTLLSNTSQEKKRTYAQNMETPDLSLPLTDILNTYGIDTYDELIHMLKKLIGPEQNEFSINRLVNIYTRIFYDDLKKSPNSLIKIFKIIFENKNIDDEKTKKFLKKWFDKNDKDSFILNICLDYKNFLSNKYE
jgi:hypothetical protein